MQQQAKLPTYRTAAAVLEGKTGSGWKLVGWTLGRSLLILFPMKLVGVPWKPALLGSMIASGVISSLAVARLFDAGNPMLAGKRRLRVKPLRGVLASRSR